MIRASSGEVTIGGTPADEYMKGAGHVGYVSEDPLLIGGTVKENLLYGLRRDVGDAELEEVLRRAGLADALSENTRVLDYMIQENGEGLSTGQKQRLALARAFLKMPTLLILDEASANLDTKAEQDVAAILEKLKGHCTTLIVSHKTELLKAADQILDLGRPHDS